MFLWESPKARRSLENLIASSAPFPSTFRATMKKKLLIATSLIVLSLFPAFAAEDNQIAESQQKWIANYQKQANVPKPESMLINTSPEPSLKKDFVSLYNGKNLDDWTPYGGHCTFEAKGDVIVGTTMPGSPSTYLSTIKDDYADFIFTAELRWEIDGNTGFMFRGQLKVEDKGKQTVFGPQAEMEADSKKRFWSGGIYGQSCGGWYYPLWLNAHEKARNAVNYEGWNRITVESIGNLSKTWINGVPAAQWRNDEYLKGFFSLQIHSGKEGSVLFRNIKVKEL